MLYKLVVTAISRVFALVSLDAVNFQLSPDPELQEKSLCQRGYSKIIPYVWMQKAMDSWKFLNDSDTKTTKTNIITFQLQLLPY